MSDSVKKWHETISEDIEAVYETVEIACDELLKDGA